MGYEGIAVGFHTGAYFLLPVVIMYIYIHSYLASFLCSVLCTTAACIAMPHLDIDRSRRLVFSCVFFKSTGYSVSQIDS